MYVAKNYLNSAADKIAKQANIYHRSLLKKRILDKCRLEYLM